MDTNIPINTNGKKRVLIFSLAYFPLVAGAEVAVKEITDRIFPKEAEFEMVTRRFSRTDLVREQIGNILVHRVGFGGKTFFPVTAFIKAVQLHQKNHFHFSWSIMANYAGFGALFFKLFHPCVPFVLTLQEGDPIEHIKKRVGVFYSIFKMIFTKADRIQAISNFLAEWAKEMGARTSPVVVPNGVDVRRFQVSSFKFQVEEREQIREKLGFNSDDTILITTSRLVEKNAVGDIIESLQYLPENVKLLIIGTGFLENDLKLKARTLNLEARINFLGFISHEELPKYLWVSDIFTRPSLSEGMGNSFIEAMVAGLPVIATPVGGIVDFLKDGETGLFCEVGNPKSIAQKVEKLMKDSESRRYILENASKMVREKYDWDLIAERMKREVFDVVIDP